MLFQRGNASKSDFPFMSCTVSACVSLTVESAPAGDVAGVVVRQDGVGGRDTGQLNLVSQAHVL